MKYLRLLPFFLLPLSVSVYAQVDSVKTTNNTEFRKEEKKETKKEEKKKKETKYDKLFKDKKYQSAKSSFISLHKIDGKLYMELPLKYLHKEMILGGAISSTTDPTYITVGMRNFNPVYFYFERQDSNVVIKTPNTIVFKNDETSPEMKRALELNYRDPIFADFRIEAYNNDSTALIFDATNLLARPNSLLPIMPKTKNQFTLTTSPKSEMSFIKELKSFDNNLTLNLEFNYSLTASVVAIPLVREIPITVGVTYSILLLPDTEMRPRLTDSRVGIFFTPKLTFASDIEKSKNTYLAQRWALEPKDKRAYANGKLSEPVKKIVYYIEPSFPTKWIEPIRKGVLAWNKAFERAGYKNVIEVHDYPTDDKNFDADNLRYNTIRYVPDGAEDANGPFWIDPRTGEIISTSIFVHSNIETLLHKWRFLSTAAADPTVRSYTLPDKAFADALTYVISHEVGHSLGLRHNFGASSTYSTDSLRNASFVAKNGITPSIMDYARFNYIAQPGDKGASLFEAPRIGEYDINAIDWNYRYYDPKKISLDEETKILEAKVDKWVKNPRLRYYNDKAMGTDPRILTEDLGNDAIKAANYGIHNLRTVLNNLPSWIKNDEDSRKKEALNLAIAQQYYAHFKNVLALVGGIYLNDMKPSTNVPYYQVVPRERQRTALQWLLKQAKTFRNYANRSMEKGGFMSISYYDQLMEFISYDLMGLRLKIAVSEHLDKNSYTQKEYFSDLFNSIFQSVKEKRAPSQEEVVLQDAFMSYSRATVNAAITSSKSIGGETSYGNPNFPYLPNIRPAMVDKSDIYFYSLMLELKPILEKAISANIPADGKAHYQLLLFKVNKMLEGKK